MCVWVCVWVCVCGGRHRGACVCVCVCVRVRVESLRLRLVGVWAVQILVPQHQQRVGRQVLEAALSVCVGGWVGVCVCLMLDGNTCMWRRKRNIT